MKKLVAIAFTFILLVSLVGCGGNAQDSIIAHFRDRITGKIYQWLNYALGCLMTGFDIVMVIHGIIST